ncbi:MAG: hypothetical protein G3W71_22040, partial [Xanthomonas perforans]|nr:hypothetical protein [Xanthomonas perforans]
RVDVVLRFPCQAGRRVSTSQDILQAFYELALAEGLVTPTRAAARAPKTPPVSTEPVSR